MLAVRTLSTLMSSPMNTQNTQTAIDWDEVSREAHELALRHGRNAHVHAEKLAEKAEAVDDLDGAQFWKAVFLSLRPRVDRAQTWGA